MSRMALLLHKHMSRIQKVVLDLLFGGQIKIWQMQEGQAQQRKGVTVKPEVLKQSFAMVKPISEQFSSYFYKQLFEHYPATRKLFPEGEEGMRRQEKALVSALAIIVAGMNSEGDLTTYLQGLGNRHAKYGAQAEHFPIVGTLLIQTFKDMLGSKFTPAMEDAWSEAYAVISAAMRS